MKYTLEFDAVTGPVAYKPLRRQVEPSMGTPWLGGGMGRGRQWRESGQVLEGSVLLGRGQSLPLSELLLLSELKPDTHATSKP